MTGTQAGRTRRAWRSHFEGFTRWLTQEQRVVRDGARQAVGVGVVGVQGAPPMSAVMQALAPIGVGVQSLSPAGLAAQALAPTAMGAQALPPGTLAAQALAPTAVGVQLTLPGALSVQAVALFAVGVQFVAPGGVAVQHVAPGGSPCSSSPPARWRGRSRRPGAFACAFPFWDVGHAATCPTGDGNGGVMAHPQAEGEGGEDVRPHSGHHRR